MSRLAINNNFSLKRFNLVLKRFIIFNRQSWLLGYGAGFGFLLLIWLIPITLSTPDSSHYSFDAILSSAFLIYTLGGLLLTSHLFYELHSSASAYQLLTLPAATFEILFSAWLISSLGYTLAVVIGLIGLSIVVESISAILMGSFANYSLFNPFRMDFLATMGTYLGYQSIFLFGAVFFRKNNFLKTLISIIIIFMMIAAVSVTTFFFIMSSQQDGFETVEMGVNQFSSLYWIFWFIVIITMFLMSYIRLKKRELV